MDNVIRNWLLEDSNPEVKLRFLKEGLSVPAFKPGRKNEANKWITLYSYMAKGEI